MSRTPPKAPKPLTVTQAREEIERAHLLARLECLRAIASVAARGRRGESTGSDAAAFASAYSILAAGR